MSEIIIFHHNRCSKSRAACRFLAERNIVFKTKDYINDSPEPSELKVLLKKLGMKPSELVRVSEGVYKENFKGKTISDEEWIEILCNNPVLIERPIIIHGNRAVVGRPAEKILEVI